MQPNWFIAAPIDPGAWFTALPAPPPSAWRFTVADLHVTVAFLGPCGEAAAQRAWSTITSWTGGELIASLDSVRPFGRSALAAPLRAGRPGVVSLMEAVAAPARAAVGLPPETRDPDPHLTLARTHRTAGRAEREAARAWAASLPMLGTLITLSELALYTQSADRLRQFRIVCRRNLSQI